MSEGVIKPGFENKLHTDGVRSPEYRRLVDDLHQTVIARIGLDPRRAEVDMRWEMEFPQSAPQNRQIFTMQVFRRLPNEGFNFISEGDSTIERPADSVFKLAHITNLSSSQPGFIELIKGLKNIISPVVEDQDGNVKGVFRGVFVRFNAPDEVRMFEDFGLVYDADYMPEIMTADHIRWSRDFVSDDVSYEQDIEEISDSPERSLTLSEIDYAATIADVIRNPAKYTENTAIDVVTDPDLKGKFEAMLRAVVLKSQAAKISQEQTSLPRAIMVNQNEHEFTVIDASQTRHVFIVSPSGEFKEQYKAYVVDHEGRTRQDIVAEYPPRLVMAELLFDMQRLLSA